MRLMVVDDHEVVRRGVRSLLLEKIQCEICGEAIDGQEALDKARELKPDLIVMDVSMPRLNGLEATRRLRNLLPQCEVLILSQHDSPEMARQALKAGARGYVVKSSIARDLISAVQRVRAGEFFFDPAILDQQLSGNFDVQEVLRRSAAFERALRESEELYRSTFELTAVGIAHVGSQGQWLRVNKRLCEITGYSEEELRRFTFQDITHPDDLAADLSQGEKVKSGEISTYSMEKRYIRKDGSLIWVNLTVSGVWDENRRFKHFISVVEDISAKKAAQDALRESEERLRLAQRAAHLGTFEWDMATGGNYWTPELERMYGLQPGTFAGSQDGFLELVHPADRNHIQRLVEKATKEGESEGEWRIVRPDGAIRWMFGRALVFKDKHGNPERMIGVNIDVTEQKKAHEALQESQDQLSLALESSQTAMFDWDLIEQRGKWNPQMAAIYEFNPQGDHISVEEWRGLFHPDDVIRLAQEAERVWLGKDEHFSFEFRSPRRDGQLRWMLSRGRIVRDSAGRAVRMIGTHSDITDRKALEAERWRSEQQFKAFFHSSAVGAVRVDVETGKFLEANETFCRLLGYSREELESKTFLDVTHQDDFTVTLQRFEEKRKQRRPTCRVEKRYVRKDGTAVWVEIVSNVVEDETGEPRYYVGIVNDISERKRIDEELRHAEQKMRFSLEAANIGTWEWDIGTGVVQWSPNMESVHDQPPGSFGNSFDRFLERVFADDREKITQDIKSALSGGGTYHTEYRQQRADGTLGWMEAHGRVLFDHEGKPSKMLGICANITQRKHSEEALQKSEERFRKLAEKRDPGINRQME